MELSPTREPVNEPMDSRNSIDKHGRTGPLEQYRYELVDDDEGELLAETPLNYTRKHHDRRTEDQAQQRAGDSCYRIR